MRNWISHNIPTLGIEQNACSLPYPLSPLFYLLSQDIIEVWI